MLEHLKRSAEWYWQIPDTPSNHQTAWTWSTTGPLSLMAPWHWCFLLFVICSFIIGLTYKYQSGIHPKFAFITILRRALIASLLLLAASGLTAQLNEFIKLTRALVIDASKSMSIKDSEPSAAIKSNTRFDQLIHQLTADNNHSLNKLSDEVNLDVYLLSDRLSHLGVWNNNSQKIEEQLKNAVPAGEETFFRSSLSRLLETSVESPLGSIVLLTDGISTGTASQKLSTFSRNDLPERVTLMAIGVGSSEPVLDLSVAEVQLPHYVFVGESVQIYARIKSSSLEMPAFNLKIKESDTQKQVFEESFENSSTPSKTVAINFTPNSTGITHYQLQIYSTESEEGFLENNHRTLSLHVTDSQLNVLLADQEPRYEYRFLNNFLERNRSVNLHTFLASANPLSHEQDQTALQHFPDNKNALADYDVLILGDIAQDLLAMSDPSIIPDWVKNGGNLIWISGPNSSSNNSLEQLSKSSLAPLFPVDYSRTRHVSWNEEPVQASPSVVAINQFPFVRFNQLPSDVETLYSQMPPFSGYYSGYHFKETAQPVLHQNSNKSKPLVLFQKYGKGSCLFHTVDETWRWRHRKGDKYFGTYWLQAIRTLTDPRFVDSVPADHSLPKSDSYAELSQLSADTKDMQQAAALSHGIYLPLDKIDQLTPPVSSTTPVKSSELYSITVWNSFELLLLLVFLLSWEWSASRPRHRVT